MVTLTRWIGFLALGACGVAHAQQGDATDLPIRTHVCKPEKVAADEGHISQLQVPAGVSVDVFARDQAMQGHVLAAGELVGTYQQTVQPPK